MAAVVCLASVMDDMSCPSAKARSYLPLKRAIDFVAAAAITIIASPVLIAAALGVKLTSPGPVFFLQDRVGLGRRVFQPLKFRTMRGDRTANPDELVPLDHQDITRFGRFLRRYKIDELPQILNVLRGDMSLVGPRPTLPQQVAQYDDFKKRRLLVRPGLTGLAQVNGNTAISWDERIKYDVYYADHCGPGTDFMILLKTILVIVSGEERFARPFEQSPYAVRNSL